MSVLITTLNNLKELLLCRENVRGLKYAKDLMEPRGLFSFPLAASPR